MQSIIEWCALLGSWVPVQAAPVREPATATVVDANEAVRALAERTQKLAAFSATYHVTRGDGGEEEELRLYYQAPDRGRLDVVGKNDRESTWLHGSVMSRRGGDRRRRYAVEFDVGDRGLDGERFESMLDRELGRRSARAATPSEALNFRIDFEPPLAEGEDSPIVVNMAWADPKFHLLAWLDGGTSASPWQLEGDEFVRRTAKGGVVRVSKTTGFLVSLTHPSGYEAKLVRVSEEVADDALTVPPRATNEEDRSSTDEAAFLGWRTRQQRREAYEAELHTPADSANEADKREARLNRVFSFIYRPTCRRLDADYRTALAKSLADHR